MLNLPSRFLSVLSVVYQRHRLYFRTPCYNNKTNDSQLVSPFRFLWSLFSLLTVRSPVASDSPLGIDEVFLGSCKEVSETLSVGSPVSPTITHVTLSPTAYKFSKLSFNEDKEAAVSDAERLSAFYANAIYDFYGTPSGAQCVYKNGDAWPIRTGPESQWIIREAHGIYGHPMQATWRELGERVHTLLHNKEVRWTSMDPLAFAEAGKTMFSPLLIWIGVEPKSLAYELANTVAEAVTFLLTECPVQLV
jgi:hypothetical protein